VKKTNHSSDIQIVTTEVLSRTAATVITNHIRETLGIKDRFTLVLSGGSTPRNTLDLLACNYSFRSKIPWDRIHFFWGDERHVPPDHAESNYHMAQEILLSRIPVPQKNIHRIESENPDAGKAAEKYEEELRAFFKIEKGQLPRFDCVLLGFGADGHIASLFPGTEAMREESRLVVANWVKKFQTYRITLTLPVLNNADFVLFIVSGATKAKALKEVFERKGHSSPLPAHLIKPRHGKLLWLVDSAAARNLHH